MWSSRNKRAAAPSTIFSRNATMSPRQMASKAYSLACKKLERDEKRHRPHYTVRERLLLYNTMNKAEEVLNKRSARTNRRVLAAEDDDDVMAFEQKKDTHENSTHHHHHQHHHEVSPLCSQQQADEDGDNDEHRQEQEQEEMPALLTTSMAQRPQTSLQCSGSTTASSHNIPRMQSSPGNSLPANIPPQSSIASSTNSPVVDSSLQCRVIIGHHHVNPMTAAIIWNSQLFAWKVANKDVKFPTHLLASRTVAFSFLFFSFLSFSFLLFSQLCTYLIPWVEREFLLSITAKYLS